MMAEIQARQLALAFALGLFLGLFYDVYRVWFRHGGRTASKTVGDILWWLVALVLSAVALYHINGLALRGFALAMVALGCVTEQLFLSRRVFLFADSLAHLLLGVFRRLLGLMFRLTELLLWPLSFAVELLFRLGVKSVRLLQWLFSVFWRLLRFLTMPLWRPLLAVKSWLLRKVNNLLKKCRMRLKTKPPQGEGDATSVGEDNDLPA